MKLWSKVSEMWGKRSDRPQGEKETEQRAGWLTGARRWYAFALLIPTIGAVVLFHGKVPPSTASRNRGPIQVAPVPSCTATAQERAAANGWTGVPAPTPGQYIRPTRSYRRWKLRLESAINTLEGRGKTPEANALRKWVAAFEPGAVKQAATAEASGVVLADARVFRKRTVGRLIEPPPTPAFERFYGYKIVLPWNKAAYYYEANAIPPGSPYLLHENGVKDGGTPVGQREDIHMLFACAGVTDAKAKDVLIKVSGREGGFDAINTWDTGYVSVGFIQFITGETGTGNSLIRVLARMKADEQRLSQQQPGHVNQFDRFFAGHGIDVRDNQLYVRDPYTGQMLTGAAAVQLIIDDKRITAIFQDAGAKSRDFQLAQIREAYGAYYLADGPFRIPAVEVSVYQVEQTAPRKAQATPGVQGGNATAENIAMTGNVSAAPPIARLVKKRYIYGHDAIQQGIAGTIAPEALQRRIAVSTPGTVLRVVRRLPDLYGTYSEALSSEGAQVTLTDRAVQHGVRNAMETFVSAVNALQPDHALTLADLRERQNELVMVLKNRIDVLASMHTDANSVQQSNATHQAVSSM